MSQADERERFRSEIIANCLKSVGVKSGETPTPIQRDKAIDVILKLFADDPVLRRFFFEDDD